MAVVSSIALLAALGLAVLIGLHPWAATSVAPQLSVAPGLGAALGDSVAVSPGRQLAVAPARPAAGGEQTFAAVEGEAKGGEGAAGPELGIARARPVARAAPRPPEGTPEPPASEPLPPPSASPVPVAAPVASPAPAPAPELVAAPPSRPVGGSGGNPTGPSAAGPGSVDGGNSAAVLVREGDVHAFSFSFYIEPSVYLGPGSENLIMRFQGATTELPSFGLQLWDDGSGSQRGLWASGEAMGGEHFLTPVAEGAWHELAVDFRASSEGEGFYLLILDGQPVEARAWVSLIESGNSSTLIETGLFRAGERVPDAPDILFGPTQLGETLESVLP